MAAVGWAHEHDGLALSRHPHGRHVAQKHAQLHQRQRVRQDGLCAATKFEYKIKLNISMITSCRYHLIDPHQAAREAGQELDNQAMPESKCIKASGNSG